MVRSVAEFWEPQHRIPAQRAHWSRGRHHSGHRVHQRHPATEGDCGANLRDRSTQQPPRELRKRARLPCPPADPQNPPGPQVGGWVVTLRPRLAVPRLLCRASPCTPWSRSGVSAALKTPLGKGLPASSAGRGPSSPRPPGQNQTEASSGPENSSPGGVTGRCHQPGSPGSSGPRARACGGGGPGLGLVSGCRPDSLPQPRPKPGLSSHRGLP